MVPFGLGVGVFNQQERGVIFEAHLLQIDHIGVLAQELARVNPKDGREEFYQPHISEVDLPDLGAGGVYGGDGGKTEQCFVADFNLFGAYAGKRKCNLCDGFPAQQLIGKAIGCLLYTSPSPRDKRQSRMPSSA